MQSWIRSTSNRRYRKEIRLFIYKKHRGWISRLPRGNNFFIHWTNKSTIQTRNVGTGERRASILLNTCFGEELIYTELVNLSCVNSKFGEFQMIKLKRLVCLRRDVLILDEAFFIAVFRPLRGENRWAGELSVRDRRIITTSFRNGTLT